MRLLVYTQVLLLVSILLSDREECARHCEKNFGLTPAQLRNATHCLYTQYVRLHTSLMKRPLTPGDRILVPRSLFCQRDDSTNKTNTQLLAELNCKNSANTMAELRCIQWWDFNLCSKLAREHAFDAGGGKNMAIKTPSISDNYFQV